MSLFDAFATMATNSQNVRAQKEANEQNIAFQREVNQQNLDFQREINDTNYQRQLDMWNMTNAYNHPAQQMLRYKDAGLNPNLIYGQSNTTQSANVGTASAVKVDAPSVQPAMRQKLTFGNSGHDFLNALYRIEEVHNLQLDNDIKEQTKDDVINRSYYEAERQGVQLANDILKFNHDSLDIALKQIELEVSNYTKQNRMDLSDISVKQSNSNLAKTNAETDNLIVQKKLIQWQSALTYYETLLKSAQTEHELKKIGLTEKEVERVEQQINLIKTQISNIVKDTKIKGIDYDNKFIDLHNPFDDIPLLRGVTRGIIAKPLLSIYKGLGFKY